ncbi:MAG: thermostable hemolysin [Candidatus Thiodiazotropha sp. DIVDIV]
MANVRKRDEIAMGPHPRLVETLKPGMAERVTAERFVKECFKQHYGADIHHFMPLLMSLSDQQDNMMAVLGFCHADSDPLFLENYLNQPVEQVLASKIMMPVDRARLVEVGNLAVATAGGGRWLITALTAYLSNSGAEWALFTIGPALINAFNRLGLELIELGEAEAECLSEEEQLRWGRYYDQRPRVMAGNIAHGHKVLRSLCEQEQPMLELWQNAELAGRQVA